MEESEYIFENYTTCSESVDLKAEITAFLEGLFYLSESDEPFEYIELNLPTETSLIGSELLVVLQKQKDEVTEELGFEDFMDPLCEMLDWYGDEEKIMANRFLNLKNYLLSQLNDIQVFRIGEGRVEIYVLGKVADCTKWAGVKTVSIET